MLLSDIIINSCNEILREQKDDGSFLPGWNGPYHDTETPVRNTSHWLITLLKAFELTNESKYKDAAIKATDYLASAVARPMVASFFCRTNPQKDFCNGLIGQAWVIEALATASRIIEDDALNKLAKDVFILHPFEYDVGLWKIVNVDGSYSSFDKTFNHQLWFAAAGSMIVDGSNSEIKKQINRFLDQAIKKYLHISRNGRISHLIEHSIIKSTIIKTITIAINPRRYHQTKKQMKHKEIGYHAFNLYAFAILKNYIPEHPIWKNDKFISALQFVNNQNCISGLEDNEFAYPYNPTGFEMAYAMQIFDSKSIHYSNSEEWWVEQQFKRCFDFKRFLMDKNTEDKNTHAARIYEATRLRDMHLNLTD